MFGFLKIECGEQMELKLRWLLATIIAHTISAVVSSAEVADGNRIYFFTALAIWFCVRGLIVYFWYRKVYVKEQMSKAIIGLMHINVVLGALACVASMGQDIKLLASQHWLEALVTLMLIVPAYFIYWYHLYLTYEVAISEDKIENWG